MTDTDPLVRTLAEIVVELAYVLEDAIGVDGEPPSTRLELVSAQVTEA